jgi:hypothetical protein
MRTLSDAPFTVLLALLVTLAGSLTWVWLNSLAELWR